MNPRPGDRSRELRQKSNLYLLLLVAAHMSLAGIVLAFFAGQDQFWFGIGGYILGLLLVLVVKFINIWRSPEDDIEQRRR